ncbi:uncharacterized protein [Drosophila pseudoobscura]|uniref:Uncharacterized protein n=1 Tax=Drosophila pseudoobscura pseudoobscura TaxID=46245 RepID=A0A6I8UIC2_DROPS|nr:uncharacterized protein LOC4816392 [Drosophila pseudoobscura]
MSTMSYLSSTSTGSDFGSVLRFHKTLQAPLYDLLGPYPDEIIMATLDRILYYSGATKVIRMLAMSVCAPEGDTPDKERAATSCGSVPSLVCPSTSAVTCCSWPPSNCSYRKVPSTPCKQKPSCIKRASKKPSSCCNRSTSSLPRRRSPRVDFCNPVDDFEPRKIGGECLLGERIKESLSTCALTCARLKLKLSTRASSAPSNKNKWLWTKLVSARDGYKVYEVFKESNAEQDPSQIVGKGSPVIVFLVLPNGYIMPFESISTD